MIFGPKGDQNQTETQPKLRRRCLLADMELTTTCIVAKRQVLPWWPKNNLFDTYAAYGQSTCCALPVVFVVFVVVKKRVPSPIFLHDTNKQNIK